ncbi:hypothetical protein NMY3_03659 [Candidatus Nitrosocosmicus oleophilus]|uniref:Uncharacterized protein n=1 Tax=Candidatus Nitrosocosmicus oleophilus TaxID=1353260 RepID=A0A654M576_9ARCH|nr:hypothetical protein NMY3_03659 [Candidatus Nitrosocosmicus oleophilus]
MFYNGNRYNNVAFKLYTICPFFALDIIIMLYLFHFFNSFDHHRFLIIEPSIRTIDLPVLQDIYYKYYDYVIIKLKKLPYDV